MSVTRCCDHCGVRLTPENDATRFAEVSTPQGKIVINRRDPKGDVCVPCVIGWLSGRAGVHEIPGYGTIVDNIQPKLRRLN